MSKVEFYHQNRLNEPDENANVDKDKLQYQEEYFCARLKSYFKNETNRSNSDLINDVDTLRKSIILQMTNLILRFSAIPSFYVISKKQGTIHEEWFVLLLQFEILKPLKSINSYVPNNFPLVLFII